MGPATRRLLAVSTFLYRGLLHGYPRPFRREYGEPMAQLFSDLCRSALQQRGGWGLLRLWAATLHDLLTTLPLEHLAYWRDTMQRREATAIVLGIPFLLYSLAFVVANTLYYSLGLPVWNPFVSLLESGDPSLLRALLNVLVLAGPGVALALFLLPHLDVRLAPRAEQLVIVTVHRGSRASLILIGLCLALFGVFALYFVAENFSCLIGRQPVC